jgi:hypothetical protein
VSDYFDAEFLEMQIAGWVLWLLGVLFPHIGLIAVSNSTIGEVSFYTA